MNAPCVSGRVISMIVLARPLACSAHPEFSGNTREIQEILVDEYQDTNPVQDELVALLSRAHGRVFAVGDDDQGIYGWRGAQVENILQFERRFAGAQVFRLEENYRSSGAILNVASRIVGEAGARHEKRLFTRNPPGEAVPTWRRQTPKRRAEGVIKLLMDAGRAVRSLGRGRRLLPHNTQRVRWSKRPEDRDPYQV